MSAATATGPAPDGARTLAQLQAGQLAGLRRLDLSVGLDRLPPEVFALADTLEVLNLSGNRLDSLPDDLPRLHRLKLLFCSDNRFTELPAVLGRCEALEMVGFKANRIAEVPASALPPRLRWLILTDNHVEQLPATLGERPRLQKLMLAGNRLRRLPASIGACRALELLRISANRFDAVGDALPDELLELPRLAWLAHGGNPYNLAAETQVLAERPVPAVPWSRLRIGERLGEGASGVIEEAWLDDRLVAVKLFKGEVTSDGLPRSELAAALAAGAHPQLVDVEGRVRDHPDGLDGLVLRRIPVGWRNLAAPPSLESCTRDVYTPPLPAPAAAARIVQGVAAALDHLHVRGMTHGDLYAHNTLVDAGGQALLGDLGAASFLPADDARRARALRGLDRRALRILQDELHA